VITFRRQQSDGGGDRPLPIAGRGVVPQVKVLHKGGGDQRLSHAARGADAAVL
jgi:hypothetical protein